MSHPTAEAHPPTIILFQIEGFRLKIFAPVRCRPTPFDANEMATPRGRRLNSEEESERSHLNRSKHELRVYAYALLVIYGLSLFSRYRFFLNILIQMLTEPVGAGTRCGHLDGHITAIEVIATSDKSLQSTTKTRYETLSELACDRSALTMPLRKSVTARANRLDVENRRSYLCAYASPDITALLISPMRSNGMALAAYQRMYRKMCSRGTAPKSSFLWLCAHYFCIGFLPPQPLHVGVTRRHEHRHDVRRVRQV
ncbi:hypothetical protein EVAR_31711_1 [Eumeta japonica]|uniref:Uncharacterized protein n=1 Tax=Eumeta variegata TaxID=151549 RepID=A0A4C1VS64_EUMVA|nr:hypothetical protein EVAR_31711_1 [Eumeta japonica]